MGGLWRGPDHGAIAGAALDDASQHGALHVYWHYLLLVWLVLFGLLLTT
jgi:heme/copper-type cytochrome/quinol oxidase subunit 3